MSMVDNTVWQIRDTFRGTAEPSRLRIYILTLVFLRYLASLGSSDEVVVPKAADFECLLRNEDGLELDIRINEALRSIEEANSHLLGGVLSRIDFTSSMDLGKKRHRVKQLAHVIELLAQLEMASSSDEQARRSGARDLWARFLESWSNVEGRVGRSFNTPAGLASLIARIASPRDGDRICDPFAGSGSLLVESSKISEASGCAFFGQENNYREWLVCRMNLTVHGMYDSRVEFGDTLRDPGLLEAGELMKFDVVMSCPPFGLKNWGEDPVADRWGRYSWGLPPLVNGDWATLSHILSILSDRGRAVVVVPSGVLFRSGVEGQIRKSVVESNLIESVIYLPSKALGVTTAPLALLIFSKSKTDDSVIFIDGRCSSAHAQGRVELSKPVADEILAIWADGKPDEVLVHRASIDAIAEREFDLSAQHYLGQFSDRKPADTTLIWEKLESVESELLETWDELQAATKALE